MGKVEGVNINDAVGYVKLPPGIHLLEIQEMTEGVAKSSGERKLDVTFKVIAVGSDDPAEKQKAGGLVGMALSLQPKALWKLKQLRDASGTPAVDGDSFDTDDFTGRQVRAATSVKNFTDENGKTTERTQIDDFLSAA